MKEIGKWKILEADKEFITLTCKCYLCSHWTIVRIERMTLEKAIAEEEV